MIGTLIFMFPVISEFNGYAVALMQLNKLLLAIHAFCLQPKKAFRFAFCCLSVSTMKKPLLQIEEIITNYSTVGLIHK